MTNVRDPICHDPMAPAFEPMEPRLALSLGAGAQEMYFPDGFANTSITELVSISNPGMLGVEFELWARYETGERDQLIRAGFITPGGREEVFVSGPTDAGDITVRSDTPFSFVLRSNGPLGATLRHDDFGASAGESFTSRTSSEWTLPSITRNHATTRDFILVYNPGANPVQVQVEFWSNSQLALSLTATVDAMRRSGWNINRLAQLDPGQYSVRVVASDEVVVGHSHFNLVDHVSSINIATFDRGALAGTILSASFDERTNHGCGPGEDTLVAAFNPGETDAVVTLHYIVRDGTSFAPEPTELTIPARGRQWVSLQQLGFTDHDVSIVWESDERVSVAAFTRRASSFVVLPSMTVAATEWDFATGFIDRVHASVMNTQNILAFNPTDADVEVTFTFTFRNGATALETRTIGAFEVVSVEALMPVQHIGAGHPFSVRVVADGPVVAALENWNHRRLRGQFAAQGIPAGTTTPLSEVLVVPSRSGSIEEPWAWTLA